MASRTLPKLSPRGSSRSTPPCPRFSGSSTRSVPPRTRPSFARSCEFHYLVFLSGKLLGIVHLLDTHAEDIIRFYRLNCMLIGLSFGRIDFLCSIGVFFPFFIFSVRG